MIFLIIAMLAIFASASQSEQNSRLRKLNGALTKVWKELAVGGGLCTETQGYANNKIAGGEHYSGLNGKQGCKEKCASMPNCACYAGKNDGYCHTGDATECSNVSGDASYSDWIWGKCTLPRPAAAQTKDEPAASEVSEPTTGCATLVSLGIKSIHEKSDFPLLTAGTTALSSCTDKEERAPGCMNLQQCRGLCDVRSKDLLVSGVCAVQRYEKPRDIDGFVDSTASCYFVPNVDDVMVPDTYSLNNNLPRWTSSCTKPATASVLPEYPDCRVMDSDEKIRVNSNLLTGTVCPDKMSVHGMTATKRIICCPKN